MSYAEKDRKDRSKSGKDFSDGGKGGRIGSAPLASLISSALQREYRGHPSAVKTVAKHTGANERAVKNWFEGKNAPNGEFLIILCGHSEKLLETVLSLAGRSDLVKAKLIYEARERVREILRLLDEADH